MKVIVTGAAGFIGGHLARELEQHGHTVVGVDRVWWGSHDLRFPDNVCREIRDADVCVHLAAKVGRLFGEDDPVETINDNVAMTALVAKACGEQGIRLCYASTSEVYGDNGDSHCDEEGGPFTRPHNLYGISKGFGEEVCHHYAPERLTVFRFSMPYGPGLPAGRGRAAIINMLHQALHGREIPVHRGAVRSWCWVGDTVAAVRLLLEQTEGGTFNVGRDDQPLPMLDIAARACRLVGAPYHLIRETDAPAAQTVVKHLSTRKLAALGWKPQVDIEEGMQRTLDWVRSLDADGNHNRREREWQPRRRSQSRS